MTQEKKLEEKLKETSRFENKLIAFYAGSLTAIGGMTAFEGAINIGNRWATRIEPYLGLVGATAIEYGMPLASAVGSIYLCYLATRGTYNYLKSREENIK